MATTIDDDDQPTFGEMAEDIAGLLGAAAVGLLPLFVLSVPFAVLLGLALVPLLAVGAVAGLACLALAVPLLALRALARALMGRR
jgi:hypothetical protein